MNSGPPAPHPSWTPRPKIWATPSGIKLCRLEDIDDPGSRGIVLQIGEAYFHGFLVRRGAGVRGYIDRCPHMDVLMSGTNDYLTPDRALIVCNWHGALFQPEDGLCVGGPCVGAKLRPWAVMVNGEHVETA